MQSFAALRSFIKITMRQERADLEAKKAARDPTTSQPFCHRPLKSARIRCIKEDAKRQWAEHWKNAKTAHNLRRMLK
jgi:hypothetical protein